MGRQVPSITFLPTTPSFTADTTTDVARSLPTTSMILTSSSSSMDTPDIDTRIVVSVPGETDSGKLQIGVAISITAFVMVVVSACLFFYYKWRERNEGEDEDSVVWGEKKEVEGGSRRLSLRAVFARGRSGGEVGSSGGDDSVRWAGKGLHAGKSCSTGSWPGRS
jgi:hypothetical protein